MKPFFVSIPHSGERVPDETPWLHGLEEPVLMCDVDRFVDVLYKPAIEQLQLPSVVAEWHRYVVDLNRLPDDIDQDSVRGSDNPSGTFPIGLHWSVTTKGDKLIKEPMSRDLHQSLVDKYFEPFHADVRNKYAEFKAQGCKKVFQLDAHSMPSLGTDKHRDPGQTRPQIVVSDYEGKSCEPWYTELVVESYKKAGFEVKTNWPYIGGRVTQTYGKPELGQNAIQVEMSRALYMNEESKKLDEAQAQEVQKKVLTAVKEILQSLPEA